jgi:DNA-binding transcriptional regulator YdaS (Cro superfamily)
MTIKEAVTAAGGATAVAEKFKISPVSVYEWISKDRLPAERVIPLAEMTGWGYTPNDLDPVLYPHALDGLPKAVRVEHENDRRTSSDRRAWAERRKAERKAAAALAAALKGTP